MSDVTRILGAIESGDAEASEELLPLVYEELRKLAAARMAGEDPGNTLQATSLVHEAYLRLVDVKEAQEWNSRGHFFAAAAEAMRRILIDRARGRKRIKRGGDRQRIDLDDVDLAMTATYDELDALNEALDKLAEVDPVKAELVQLRYFAGLTLEQAAEMLNLSRATASRYWTYARAWLFHEIRGGDASQPND